MADLGPKPKIQLNVNAAEKTRGNPQIYYYLKKYQDAPNSRVFAPLAEAYRKAGLIDEAIEIAREGVEANPTFVGGKVALARALFDKGQYQEVIRVVQPMVRDVPDNLVAQRILGESFLLLNRPTEALECFKMLLFFVPQDQELADLIQELEVNAYQEGTAQLVFKGELPVSPTARIEEPLDLNEWRRKVNLLQNLLITVSGKSISS